MRLRWLRGGVATAAAALLVGAAITTQAEASVSQGYVVGVGTLTDDFGDEGPLSRWENSHNSVVWLWQSILAADGYLGRSDIDCRFGPRTAEATMEWQADRGLSVDGVVGPETFGTADDKLYWIGGEIQYEGSQYYVGALYRLSNGRYWTTAGAELGDRTGISYHHANACS